MSERQATTAIAMYVHSRTASRSIRSVFFEYSNHVKYSAVRSLREIDVLVQKSTNSVLTMHNTLVTG